MKLCRVFVSEYPGKSIGDIFDVIDPLNHPGSLLSGTIKEVEVADDFDKDIMVLAIKENKWVKQGEADVYVDPSDISFTMVPGPHYLFSEDAAKVAAKALKTKEAAILVKYNEMSADVLAEMEAVFGTKLPESANASHETWKLMVAKPELFASEGLVADKAVVGFTLGAALNTNQKVQDYANLRIAEAEAYGVSRALRIKQFREERAAILAG